MAVQAAVYGGHDNDFVGKVADRFICQICTKVLREPHLAVCCGQHFCESCLNKWFIRQQGRQSCPHCRAEGDAFSHVINKGLRSEINQLKIRCINRGEGCEWTGELGTLKTHLESERGCGFVVVECPNKCLESCSYRGITTCVNRKDLNKHLCHCYLRPYQCEFCGLKDTYEAITGEGHFHFYDAINPYYGHQAKCPEAPLPCPNECGSSGIKRKDMENHRSKCPQEPVECPFAEAGCKSDLRRHQLEDHMTSSQERQHLMMVMKDYKVTKSEFCAVKEKLQKTEREVVETKNKLGQAESKISKNETELFEKILVVMKDYVTKSEFQEVKEKLKKTESELDKTKQKLDETENKLAGALVRLSVAEADCVAWADKLAVKVDSITIQMSSFSEYRRSGKVWHSPPFYYREGYKMCLAVYANGVGKGAGTHISVLILLLKGCYDDQLKWPIPCKQYGMKCVPADGYTHLSWCAPIQRAELNEPKEITRCDRFCPLNSTALKLVNDCLTLKVTMLEESILSVRIV